MSDLYRRKCLSCQGEYQYNQDHICPAIRKDAVDPDHYKAGGIETIDYLRAKMTPEMFEGYCLGNVLKYCSRYRLKAGTEDLKKAQVYLNWLVESADERP